MSTKSLFNHRFALLSLRTQRGRSVMALVVMLLMVLFPSITPVHASSVQQPSYDVQAIYTGTMVMNVIERDVYGNPKPAQYQTNVEVLIGDVRPNETNPFNFMIASVPMVGQAGEISMASALPALGATFQYWTFTYNQGQLVGQITNGHTAEAIAYNLYTINKDLSYGLVMPFPEAMPVGTTMEGVIDDQNFQLVVRSGDGNTWYPFELAISAVRAQ